MMLNTDFNYKLEQMGKDLEKLLDVATYGQRQQLIRLGIELAKNAIDASNDEIKRLGR